jgi:arylsulfatase A-like enzyme
VLGDRLREVLKRVLLKALRLWVALPLAIFLITANRGCVLNSVPVSRPNIVLFVADDLGWKDVGYHGSEILTPHIDALAGEGMRFERFYAMPMCSPTRAALLTGRYPIRYGLQSSVISAWAGFGLSQEEVLISNHLAQEGYFNAMLGKWHLGWHEESLLPLQRGFHLDYGCYNGFIDYYTHTHLGGLDWHRNQRPLEEGGGYATTLIADEAIRIIEEYGGKKPLFLYIPFNAVHGPLQAPRDIVDRYGFIGDEDRRTFAAMTEILDHEIGRIVQVLEREGIRENTLILFLSDNGGPLTMGSVNEPLRGGKGSLFEGGVRVPAFANWPGVIEAGKVILYPVHAVDILPTILRLTGAGTTDGRELDGVNLLSALTGGDPPPERTILLNVNRKRGAVVRGEWKLIVEFDDGGGVETVSLYDVVNDVGENVDLAASEPDLTAQLLDELLDYRSQAVPQLDAPLFPPPDFHAPAVWIP